MDSPEPYVYVRPTHAEYVRDLKKRASPLQIHMGNDLGVCFDAKNIEMLQAIDRMRSAVFVAMMTPEPTPKEKMRTNINDLQHALKTARRALMNGAEVDVNDLLSDRQFMGLANSHFEIDGQFVHLTNEIVQFESSLDRFIKIVDAAAASPQIKGDEKGKLKRGRPQKVALRHAIEAIAQCYVDLRRFGIEFQKGPKIEPISSEHDALFVKFCVGVLAALGHKTSAKGGYNRKIVEAVVLQFEGKS